MALPICVSLVIDDYFQRTKNCEIGGKSPYICQSVSTMSDQDNVVVIAEGLQRQLDELRAIIQLGFASRPQQPQLPPHSSADSGNRDQEVEKLHIRVEHLVRALDAKDAIIQHLRDQLNRP